MGNPHPTPRKSRLTAEEVIEAIQESKGLVTIAAKRLACSRMTVLRYVERYPAVKEALNDSREALKDYAESRLLRRIEADDIVAIIFFLKTQAKDRGYVERHQVTGDPEGGVPVKVIVNWTRDAE